MVRGTYTAATGMMVQRNRMDTVTNNIVNSDTTGYKKDNLVVRSFDDVMVARVNGGSSSQVGYLGSGARVDQIYTDLSAGGYEETGYTTDLAIMGDGYFVYETAAGQRYSRAGSLTVNAEGYLTDSNGNYLMGANGRIYVGTDSFTVDTQGNIYIGDTVIDQVRVVTFADGTELTKEGSGLFYTGAAPVAAENYVMYQGYLETSNVDITREMVDMITLYRAYESNQRMLSMIDETVGKAVNEIGRLR